jgi:formylmethanofuran dehydrogenase subunit C
MNDAVTLTLRTRPEGRLDLEGITPDRCASLSERQIAGLPLLTGGRPAAVGDFFDVRGATSSRLWFQGDLAHADRIGAAMLSGELTVEGDAGDDVGMAMAGGVVRIRGNAGHRVGGPTPGGSKGMTGGEILIGGNAGDDVAARVRRGLVVVGGRAGASAGRAMIAGTLLVFGPVGDHPAEGNKRGSLIALGDIHVPASYRYACTFEPPFVRLLMTHLSRHHRIAIEPRVLEGMYKRFCGDAGGPGKGEILVLIGSD